MENEPDRFADYLCSQAMIPASLRIHIHTAATLSSFDKASKILQEVQRRIEFNPLHCLKFVMLMIHYDDDSALSSYGKTIKHLLGKLYYCRYKCKHIPRIHRPVLESNSPCYKQL